MPSITANDDTETTAGRGTGEPIFFHHGWPMSAYDGSHLDERSSEIRFPSSSLMIAAVTAAPRTRRLAMTWTRMPLTLPHSSKNLISRTLFTPLYRRWGSIRYVA